MSSPASSKRRQPRKTRGVSWTKCSCRCGASWPSQGLYHRALDIQARYRYGFYDALIIAAALDAGCTRLYSEDLQHGQRIDGLIIENPFKE